jgi:hypothetical protein
MEEIELTPEQIDGINKLARFIRDYTEEETRGFGGLKPPQPNTRRRPRCPSCDDGLRRNWKQLEQEEQHNNMQDEPPEK